MSSGCVRFGVQLGDGGEVVPFELPGMEFEDVAGYHIKGAISVRCGGIDPYDMIVVYHGLLYDDVLKDNDLIDRVGVMNDANIYFTLKFAEGETPPIEVIPKVDPVVILVQTPAIEPEKPIVDVLPPLLSPVEHTITLGGNMSVSSVVGVLFSGNPTHYSDGVTSVRGKVVASDGTSHVVYPFVFRAGGKDVRVTWAAELRERLAASIHPVTLGRDVYRSAIEALDDTPSPSSSVTWDLTISTSFRPSPF